MGAASLFSSEVGSGQGEGRNDREGRETAPLASYGNVFVAVRRELADLDGAGRVQLVVRPRWPGDLADERVRVGAGLLRGDERPAGGRVPVARGRVRGTDLKTVR